MTELSELTFTQTEAAEALGVTRQAVSSRIKSGTLPATITGAALIREAERLDKEAAVYKQRAEDIRRFVATRWVRLPTVS